MKTNQMQGKILAQKTSNSQSSRKMQCKHSHHNKKGRSRV